ncbi:hypothetical protein [Siphonobacter sp. SORGH_AS_1065]|uniref:hypothetical protein n=1 Tax=Siphonobacter sp. SORGH_AS_1065 TaxID=3041795 RepID=UPI002782139F|nr:hypothetical protein [Siphonobacter sp. SORGH_AS_1065]MDQ1086064.1 hypothetical protein [Siphonobacter sp. SORGH_AS_1065]
MRKILFPVMLITAFQSWGQTVDQPEPERPLPKYTNGFAVGLKVGTSGVGLDIYRSINRRFDARLGVSAFNYNARFVSGSATDDIQIGLNGKIKLNTINALLDYYPFKRVGLRLTGGLMVNLNQVNFDGAPTRDVKFKDLSFTAEEVGSLSGKAEFNKVAPYIGFGFGQPFLRKRLKFNADIGFFYQQSPMISLVATKMLQPSENQGPVIEKNLQPLKYYPVLVFGLSYRLNK